MPRFRHYYFARLNILGVDFGTYEEKSGFLIKLLKNDHFTSQRSYNYMVADVETLSVEEFQILISANLIKYHPKANIERAEPTLSSTTSQTFENQIAAKVRFFLEPRTGILIYHSTNGLDRDAFRKRFEDIVEEYREGFFLDANVVPITERYEIFDAIKNFESINNFKVTLYPSNPNTDPIWDEIEAEIKRRNAKEYKEEYDAGNDSLDIRDDDDVKKKLTMAEDGYGFGEIKGIDENGLRKKVSTSDQPKKSKVPIDDAQSLNIIWSFLRETARSISQKIGNDSQS